MRQCTSVTIDKHRGGGVSTKNIICELLESCFAKLAKGTYRQSLSNMEEQYIVEKTYVDSHSLILSITVNSMQTKFIINGKEYECDLHLKTKVFSQKPSVNEIGSSVRRDEIYAKVGDVQIVHEIEQQMRRFDLILQLNGFPKPTMIFQGTRTGRLSCSQPNVSYVSRLMSKP